MPKVRLHWFWRGAIAAAIACVYSIVSGYVESLSRIRLWIYREVVNQYAEKYPASYTAEDLTASTIAFVLPIALIALIVFGLLSCFLGTKPQSIGSRLRQAVKWGGPTFCALVALAFVASFVWEMSWSTGYVHKRWVRYDVWGLEVGLAGGDVFAQYWYTPRGRDTGRFVNRPAGWRAVYRGPRCSDSWSLGTFFLLLAIRDSSGMSSPEMGITYPYYCTFRLRLWVPFLMVFVPIFYLWRKDRRPPPGHCRKCGYDLTDNVSDACPECGKRIPTTPRHRLHWLWRGTITLLIAGVCCPTVFASALETMHSDLCRWLGPIIGRNAARGIVVPIVIGLLSALLAIITYGLLTRHLGPARQDDETRCRKCGYILRGIPEPRCSECGERI